jgi:HEAT repeat protein
LHLAPSTIEKIASSLESPNLNVKKGVVFILGLTGKKQAAEHVIKALYFNEIDGEAKQALIELGNEALDVILNSYPKQEEKVRSLLCSILGEIGNKRAENILVQAIKDNYGHVRSSSAKALGKINPEKAVPEIVNLLQDEFDDVRNAAVDALCYLAPDSDKILPAILPLLSKEDPYVREKVIIVLGRIGRGTHRKEGSKGIEKIRLAIKDSSPIVRKAAVYAIEGVGEEQYVQDVIFALTDEDKQVRLAAAKVLGNMAIRKAVKPLLLTLKDEDVWVKTAAVESLGKIGGGNVIKIMKELVDNENGIIVCGALEAMAGIAGREPQTVEEIKPWAAKCLFHSDAEVVKVAAQVMARIDAKGVVNVITPLLEHPDWDVRAQVVDILSKRKDNFIRICLETHLKIETDDLVQQKIREALKG